MAKSNSLDLNNLDVDQLHELTQNAQQLIIEKKHQRLYDAYEEFERIADRCHSSIDEILNAGKRLEKKRNIKYQNPENSEQTWTGRGRKPTWLNDALNKGQDLEDFAV